MNAAAAVQMAPPARNVIFVPTPDSVTWRSLVAPSNLHVLEVSVSVIERDGEAADIVIPPLFVMAPVNVDAPPTSRQPAMQFFTAPAAPAEQKISFVQILPPNVTISPPHTVNNEGAFSHPIPTFPLL